MLWALSNSDYEIELQAFEEEVSAFDIKYFGYIKILNYRSWAYFTKSQITHLQTLFKLKAHKKKLANYTSGVHFSKKSAKEKKYYLNTWLFHFVSCYSKESLRSMIPNFFTSYLFKPWKTASHWHWYLSDREEVVFKEDVFFTQKRLGKMLLFTTHSKTLEESSSLVDLLTKLSPKGADKNFINEFKEFFIKNKFRKDKYDRNYQPNLSLINYCEFLSSNFTFTEVKNFQTYKKMICFIFANPKIFPNTESKLEDWTYCFNTLSSPNRVTSFLKWNFFSESLSKMKKVLKDMASLNLPYSRHKDPVYAFNFYSKRYCQNKQPNFSFLALSNTDNLSVSKNLKAEDNDLFVIKKVVEFNELHEIGAKLHNCAGNEETLTYYLSSLSFSVLDKRSGKLYLGTIKRGKLRQLKGFKNSAPPQDLFNSICQALKKQNIITQNHFNYDEVCVHNFR